LSFGLANQRMFPVSYPAIGCNSSEFPSHKRNGRRSIGTGSNPGKRDAGYYYLPNLIIMGLIVKLQTTQLLMLFFLLSLLFGLLFLKKLSCTKITHVKATSRVTAL